MSPLAIVLFAICAGISNAAPTAGVEKRLIAFSETESRWMTPDEVEGMIGIPGRRNNFRDITDVKPTNRTLDESAIPEEPVHKDLVEGLVEYLDKDGIESTITQLQSYFNRYYTTKDGADAVDWIESQYKAAAGTRTDIVIDKFEHSWLQPSLVVKILGTGRFSAETIILGAHIDSIAGGATSRAPGADDDGSGSATILEVFRTLVKGGFTPERTIEFHHYAAEEVGLRGSAAVATEYDRLGRNVVSMVQWDMVGYPANTVDPIGLTTDYVSPVLTEFVGKLVDVYSGLTHTTSTCGYGCSDHASWTAVRVPSSFPFECPFGKHNPAIHTTNDLLSAMSMDRANGFAKLGIGYAVEMSLVGSAVAEE